LSHVSLLIGECGLFAELLKDILNALLDITTAEAAAGSGAWTRFMIQLVECQRSLGEYSDAIKSQKGTSKNSNTLDLAMNSTTIR
jgi:hypothetical protein